MTQGAIQRYILILFLGLCGASAYAHDRSESFSEWTWRGDRVHYSFSVLQREVTRLPGSQATGLTLAGLLERYLSEKITVSSSSGQACTVEQEAIALPSRKGFLHAEGSFHCAGPQAPVVNIDTFFDFAPTHTHYAKVRSGGQVEEFLLTKSRRSHNFTSPGVVKPSAQTGLQAFVQYVEIGAKHILSGADHLAFLLGLVLLASGWREMTWLITGFTLGHSVSLALAVLGFAQPNAVMVEALIGFTIVLVAIESSGRRDRRLASIAPVILFLCLALSVPLWWLKQQWELVLGTMAVGFFAYCYLCLAAEASRPGVLRLLVTSTFGIIHGFGFAGGLLEGDFPAADTAFVLLGFNVGVELGQMLVLIALIAVLFILRRLVTVTWLEHSANAAMMILTALGSYWFVSRLLV